jgi:hypothetical protein
VQGTTKEKDPKKADTDSVEGKEDSALPSQKEWRRRNHLTHPQPPGGRARGGTISGLPGKEISRKGRRK